MTNCLRENQLWYSETDKKKLISRIFFYRGANKISNICNRAQNYGCRLYYIKWTENSNQEK